MCIINIHYLDAFSDILDILWNQEECRMCRVQTSLVYMKNSFDWQPVDYCLYLLIVDKFHLMQYTVCLQWTVRDIKVFFPFHWWKRHVSVINYLQYQSICMKMRIFYYIHQESEEFLPYHCKLDVRKVRYEYWKNGSNISCCEKMSDGGHNEDPCVCVQGM